MKEIVKFEKDDCNPCRQVSDYFNTRRVQFVAVNPFDAPEEASRYKVRSVPTTLLLEDGREVMRVVGYQPEQLDLLIQSV